MFLIEGPDRVLYHVEPIDLENNEYLFWNADGCAVRLTLERAELTKIEEAENEITLREAFARYSEALGAKVDTSGALAEVWARLQANVKPPSKLSRALRHSFGIGCLLIIIVVAILVFVFFGAILWGVIKAIFS